MTYEQPRLEVIGANATGSLQSAAERFHRLGGHSSTGDEQLANLDGAIRSARAELEKCLRGFDSFDALAFLRLAVGPWDFTDLRESESRLENSQAAADVVAAAFLGMGLPRRPLTGHNSGQPDPGRAMELASHIVEAAGMRALYRASAVDRPLGALAGEFLMYELWVRGRQFQSIATELNTGLLNDPTVASVLKGLFGFTLDDVRAVREASVALLNERLFSARDRLGDAVESGSGDIDADALRRDANLMLNECRLFGAVSASDAACRSGVAEPTSKAVLDFFASVRPVEGEADPVTCFTQGERVVPSGLIADGDEYLLLNGFLGEDELRRAIERGLVSAVNAKRAGAGRASEKYNRRRASHAEATAGDALSRLLAARPRWAGQKFIGPITDDETAAFGRDADRAGVPSKVFESDLLFLVDGVALCVEVKAGSITDKARGGNAARLATDLEKTLKEANQQAARLTRLIRVNHGVWGPDGKWIDLASAEEVHSIIVMLDDMGPLSLSMNELAQQGVIETDEVPWIVSLHDLVVVGRAMDHPAQFLEYVRRRRGRRLATMVTGADELDMFMWFLNGGMFFEPDPREVAAQMPVDAPVKTSDLRRFENRKRVRLGTLTDPLDAWFYSLEGLSRADAPKPTRQEQPWVEDFLTASEVARSPGWLRFGADLVGLSKVAQRDIGKALGEQRKSARNGQIERSLTTHSATSAGSWLLTASVVPNGASTDHLPQYLDAKQYQTQASRSMLLLYGPDGSLTASRYRGSPQHRTVDRDAEVEMAPLHSLAETFRAVPPSARRSSKQLRGKRGKHQGRRG